MSKNFLSDLDSLLEEEDEVKVGKAKKRQRIGYWEVFEQERKTEEACHKLFLIRRKLLDKNIPYQSIILIPFLNLAPSLGL